MQRGCYADNNRVQVFHRLEALLYCFMREPDFLWPLFGYPHMTTFLLIGQEQGSMRYVVLPEKPTYRKRRRL